MTGIPVEHLHTARQLLTGLGDYATRLAALAAETGGDVGRQWAETACHLADVESELAGSLRRIDPQP